MSCTPSISINARMIDLYIHPKYPQQSRIIDTQTEELIQSVACCELVAHAEFNIYLAKLHYSSAIGDQEQFQSGIYRHQEIIEWVYVHHIFMEGYKDNE